MFIPLIYIYIYIYIYKFKKTYFEEKIELIYYVNNIVYYQL